MKVVSVHMSLSGGRRSLVERRGTGRSGPADSAGGSRSKGEGDESRLSSKSDAGNTGSIGCSIPENSIRGRT